MCGLAFYSERVRLCGCASGIKKTRVNKITQQDTTPDPCECLVTAGLVSSVRSAVWEISMKMIWHIIYLCFYRYYPPRIWVFYPLYKFYRRRLGLPMPLSNLLVWITSAIFHGLVVGLSGDVIVIFVVTGIFVFLGVLSTIVILFVKRRNGTIYLLSLLPNKSLQRTAKRRR